jgi:hypothetical protein
MTSRNTKGMLEGDAAQNKVMAPMKEHMAGPPTKIYGEVIWTFDGKGTTERAARTTV